MFLEGRKCLINDTLNTFYLCLYRVGQLVNDHSTTIFLEDKILFGKKLVLFKPPFVNLFQTI